jgi:hypothetical protein
VLGAETRVSRYYSFNTIQEPSHMFKTWTSSALDAETVARDLEAHLNEFAEEVVSVAYAVDSGHHVLAVYREIEPLADVAVVAVAEQIIDHAQQ